MAQIEITAFRFSPNTGEWLQTHNCCIPMSNPLTPQEAFDYVTDVASDRMSIRQNGKLERWQWNDEKGMWREGWHE